jgi:putative ABC transport system ATP-binding protein
VNEVFALNNINLQIDEGDFITVIGSNGAGKSTLLNCIASCFFPDSGGITVNGSDVTRWPEYKRARYISRVFQNPLLGTCPSATIEQNLALANKRGKRRFTGLTCPLF